jgi:hypothetical protein
MSRSWCDGPVMAPCADLKLGLGGHVAPFALPHGLTLGELRDVLAKLDFRRPLPEESLFFRPELGDRGIPTIPDASWPFPPDRPFPPFPPIPLPDPFPRRFLPWPPFKWPRPLPFPFCWLFSRNWWIYHHDERHSGVASGCTGESPALIRAPPRSTRSRRCRARLSAYDCVGTMIRRRSVVAVLFITSAFQLGPRVSHSLPSRPIRSSIRRPNSVGSSSSRRPFSINSTASSSRRRSRSSIVKGRTPIRESSCSAPGSRCRTISLRSCHSPEDRRDNPFDI